VDLGGAYYNPKPQLEALEKLIRKLPDPTAPAPPPTKQRKPGHIQHLQSDQVEKLIAGYQAGATVYELGAQFGIDPRQSAGHYDDTTCPCAEPACDPTKSTRLHDSTRRAGPQPRSPNA
jgi:hypothetical protein